MVLMVGVGNRTIHTLLRVVSDSKVVWTGKVDMQSATEEISKNFNYGWVSARKMINTETYWRSKFMRLNGQKANECFA